MEMYEKILDHDQAGDLDFPEFIKDGPERRLIVGLLHPKKTKRLGNRKEYVIFRNLPFWRDSRLTHIYLHSCNRGIKGIMEDEFFTSAGFDWNALADGNMASPYVPEAIDFEDVDNLPFDKLKEDGEEEEEEEIPDDLSGWNPPF